MPEPAFRWVPAFTHTNGDIAAQVGSELGLPPDEDQRQILDATYAYRPETPDVPVCFSVATVAPRQNIKTSTWEIAALTDLFVFREPIQDWSAHLYETASKTFTHMVDLIDGRDDYRRLCRKPYLGKGDQAIELLTGERIEFHSRSRGGGRGSTVPRRTIDEALFLQPAHMGAGVPTVATFRRAQLRYASSSGLVDSAVLRGIRDRGRKGGAPRHAYFEWSAPFRECATQGCLHRAGLEVGCALDDRELWALANPALGRRIDVETLADLRQEMPAEEFAREFLGWWEDPAEHLAAVPPDAWSGCGDPASVIAGSPTLAIAVTPDRSVASLVVAGARPDGKTHVEVVEHGRLGAWFVPRVVAVAQAHGATVTFRGNAAATLAPDIESGGARVRPLTNGEYVQACGALYDLILTDRLRYPSPQPELDDAVSRASRKSTDDAWKWAGEQIGPLVAASCATWAHSTISEGGWMVSLR